MSQSTVIDVPVTRAVLMMPVLQVVEQIQKVQSAATPQMLPTLVEQQFAWFSEQNREVALEHMQAALLADRLQLLHQVYFNMTELIKYVTKDVADRVSGLACQELGYQSSCEYRATSPGSTQSFTVPFKNNAWDHTPKQWVYQRVEQFTKLMPLRALQAMARLEDVGLVPPAYWVADLVAIPITTTHRREHRSLDPVLYAQYGHWFAGIAAWV